MVKVLISSSTLKKIRLPNVLVPFPWYMVVWAANSDVMNGKRSDAPALRLLRLPDGVGNGPSTSGNTKPNVKEEFLLVILGTKYFL